MSYCLHKSKYHSVFAVLAGFKLVYLSQSTRVAGASIQDGLFRKGGARHMVSGLVTLTARGISLGKYFFKLSLNSQGCWRGGLRPLPTWSDPPPPGILENYSYYQLRKFTQFVFSPGCPY